jgi:hypothetical protein
VIQMLRRTRESRDELTLNTGQDDGPAKGKRQAMPVIKYCMSFYNKELVHS